MAASDGTSKRKEIKAMGHQREKKRSDGTIKKRRGPMGHHRKKKHSNETSKTKDEERWTSKRKEMEQ